MAPAEDRGFLLQGDQNRFLVSHWVFCFELKLFRQQRRLLKLDRAPWRRFSFRLRHWLQEFRAVALRQACDALPILGPWRSGTIS